MALKWTTPEEAIRGPREWRASAGAAGEYLIRGTLLRVIPRTRTVEEYYSVSHVALEHHTFGVASTHLGDASTLMDAKAIAQRHFAER